MFKSRVRFLADENIPPKLVEILRNLNHKYIRSMHNYQEFMGKPDDEWLPLAVKQRYICITSDRHMLAELGVAQTLIAVKARVIFFGSRFAQSRPWDQALWLLRYWHSIRDFAEGMADGQLVRVDWRGKITTVKPGRAPRKAPKRRARPAIPQTEHDDGQAALAFPSFDGSAPPADGT